jgi:hypothetical protein
MNPANRLLLFLLATEYIIDDFPALVTDTWLTPEYICGIVFILDLQEARVVGAPEGLLEVGLVGISL